MGPNLDLETLIDENTTPNVQFSMLRDGTWTFGLETGPQALFQGQDTGLPPRRRSATAASMHNCCVGGCLPGDPMRTLRLAGSFFNVTLTCAAVSRKIAAFLAAIMSAHTEAMMRIIRAVARAKRL
jgi:hypothetical protein